jgi:hypothetical protein
MLNRYLIFMAQFLADAQINTGKRASAKPLGYFIAFYDSADYGTVQCYHIPPYANVDFYCIIRVRVVTVKIKEEPRPLLALAARAESRELRAQKNLKKQFGYSSIPSG